jgi:hypothetical protein
MKILLALLIFSSSASAGYNVKIDYKDNRESAPLSIKDTVEMNLDEVKIITIPDSNYEFEISISEKKPKELKKKIKDKDFAFVEYKLFTNDKNIRTLNSSGKVAVQWGKEAGIIKYKDENQKDEMTSFKIIPVKNEL